MNARILPLDSDEHRIAQQLLPWFVNESLDASESAQVAAHLVHCARCQADVAVQVGLRAVCVDVEGDNTVERDWSAMRGRLDPAPAAPPPPRAARTARPWWKQGLQIALALQAAVMLVLAVALIGESSRSEPYRALGGAPSAEANVLAVFRADATETQMREALRAASARIVGGPTVTDAYLLRLSDAGPDALARLRMQPGVARVESLRGEPAR